MGTGQTQSSLGEETKDDDALEKALLIRCCELSQSLSQCHPMQQLRFVTLPGKEANRGRGSYVMVSALVLLFREGDGCVRGLGVR
jgi:hypothetical protein